MCVSSFRRKMITYELSRGLQSACDNLTAVQSELPHLFLCCPCSSAYQVRHHASQHFGAENAINLEFIRQAAAVEESQCMAV